METPHKDNDCEKQLTCANAAATEEFNKKKLRSEFAAWRRKIKPLYDVLGTRPDADGAVFSKLIIGDDLMETEEDINVELVCKCQEVHDRLLEQVKARKNESSELWKELQNFWNELEQKEEFGLGFTNADAGILGALRELKAQYSKRKINKSQRLQEFITELRREIADIWEQCMVTEEQKQEFPEFESCEYTESMLQIHKDELEKWKIYHQKNQDILLKVQKRETMWKKLKELEAKANDPARFVNRGGSLLKDQNMHNYLMKNLPKLETELTSLAEKFESEHGKKMKILGQDIHEMIVKEWEAFKEEKGGRKRTAPTPTKKTAPTPTKSAPILRPDLSIRRSVAPFTSSNNSNNVPPQIRPLDKRFGSKLELNTAPPAKRARTQPLKAVQDGS